MDTSEWINKWRDTFYTAILIRKVEEKFLELFSTGVLSGTVHTCIGQELSAMAFCSKLEAGDFVFSNHRCHGHYIAFCGDYAGLVAEVMGKQSGVSGGVGGSQHLCSKNFYSNGIQGGIAPVAAGMSLALKFRGQPNLGVLFIGDGTMGEGIVYEVLNLISLWQIPLLVVLENNGYAQSTVQKDAMAGSLETRSQSFAIETFVSTTDIPEELFSNALESINYVRNEQKPAFHVVYTNRLASHSKGDDTRNAAEIQALWQEDPIEKFRLAYPAQYDEMSTIIDDLVSISVRDASMDGTMTLQDYTATSDAISVNYMKNSWSEIQLSGSDMFLVNRLNAALEYLLSSYDDVVLLGEDIKSPYGGAFKATRGLSEKYPSRVLSTPISEAAIVGVCNGLALKNFRPIVEIMFGDFLLLGLDQIINHAAKFYHMYNKQARCPIIVRTPMGGGRGYGPTHSQTLDKHLLGIDNVKVIALNQLLSIKDVYDSIYRYESDPVIVIENKLDYNKKSSFLTDSFFKGYLCEISDEHYPTFRLLPRNMRVNVSIIAYGGMLDTVARSCRQLFFQCDILAEIILISKISPLPIDTLKSSISSDIIAVVEEGSAIGGFGSEVISTLVESNLTVKRACRICSLPVPIPATVDLEKEVLVNTTMIVSKILELING